MSDNDTKLVTALLVHELELKKVRECRRRYRLGLSIADVKKIEKIEDHFKEAAGARRRPRMAMLKRSMRKKEIPSWVRVIAALQEVSELKLANQLGEKYRTQQVTQTRSKKVIKLNRRNKFVEKIVQMWESITQTYFELVTAAELALEDKNPSPREIKSFCKFHTLVEVNTVADLFNQLKPFLFLDYTILEKMFSSFLKPHSLVFKLNDYIKQLEVFKSSTIVQDFMQRIEAAQWPLATSGTPRTCTVILKLVGGWLQRTIMDLDKLLKVLFQDKSYVLRHLKIVVVGNEGEERDFFSESVLLKASAGSPMFISNNYNV